MPSESIRMKKILAYILSILYYLIFITILIVFHGVQWICFNVFGYQAHKKSVDYLNFCLLNSLRILGTKITFENQYQFDRNQPYIIVSNHQSHYDISPIVWYLRRIHPKFISKKELGKGIPSVSYNLRHGGSILIDRKNPKQSLPEIKKFGEYLNKTHRSAVIFPEGTRSKTGAPKKFSPNGLRMLFKYCPEAIVIPVTINNSYKIVENGMFPLNLGIHLHIKVQKPLLVKDHTSDELLEKLQNEIIKDINY